MVTVGLNRGVPNRVPPVSVLSDSRLRAAEELNHRDGEFSGRTLEDDVLPEIQPAAAMWQQGRLTTELTKFGDLLRCARREFRRDPESEKYSQTHLKEKFEWVLRSGRMSPSSKSELE